jgi:hypothetical protein
MIIIIITPPHIPHIRYVSPQKKKKHKNLRKKQSSRGEAIAGCRRG